MVALKTKVTELTEQDIWCMRGVLAALDLVFLYDAEVIAEGIVGAIDSEKLLLVAELDEYFLLAQLTELICSLK